MAVRRLSSFSVNVRIGCVECALLSSLVNGDLARLMLEKRRLPQLEVQLNGLKLMAASMGAMA